jgi:hypothetical protein
MMNSTPLIHRFSTWTINYHPKKYTYQKLHAATRKLLDARRKSHILTAKLNGIHLATQPFYQGNLSSHQPYKGRLH